MARSFSCTCNDFTSDKITSVHTCNGWTVGVIGVVRRPVWLPLSGLTCKNSEHTLALRVLDLVWALPGNPGTFTGTPRIVTSTRYVSRGRRTCVAIAMLTYLYIHVSDSEWEIRLVSCEFLVNHSQWMFRASHLHVWFRSGKRRFVNYKHCLGSNVTDKGEPLIMLHEFLDFRYIDWCRKFEQLQWN